MSVKILIDSASDISKQEAESLGVTMLPITITFGTEEYADGVNMLPKEFYEKIIESTELPKTSQINEYAFQEVFEDLTADGSELVVITLSSKLSGTYNNAVRAANQFGNQIYVVDSLNAAVGERLLCFYALSLVKLGKSAKEIADMLNEKKTKINFYAMISTLDYLKKGGRVSSAAAFAGKLLAIRPVISVIDGEVKIVNKAMGNKNGTNILNKMVNDKGGIDFSMPYGLIYSGLDQTLIDNFIVASSTLWDSNSNEISKYILGGTIGSHIGPGAIGIAFFEK